MALIGYESFLVNYDKVERKLLRVKASGRDCQQWEAG